MSKKINRGKKISIGAKAAAGAVIAVSMAGAIGIARASAFTQEPGGGCYPPASETSGSGRPLVINISAAKDMGGGGGAQPLRNYADVPFVVLPVAMDPEDQAKVFDICQGGGVSFPLVMALIEQESSFDPLARSSTGDSGLMQINDCNKAALKQAGFEDLFILEDNVGAGVYMLADLFGRYGDDTAYVLMAYNAGEKGARRLREAGVYETEYSKRIMQRSEFFSRFIDAALSD